jgi:hypothetical protein
MFVSDFGSVVVIDQGVARVSQKFKVGEQGGI